jgi:hypothetical protein
VRSISDADIGDLLSFFSILVGNRCYFGRWETGT